MSPRAVLLGTILACAFYGFGGAARASVPDVSVADELRLAEGQTLSYPQTVTRRGRRYVGGVTYTVVAASVGELTALLSDASAYRQVLPYAREANVLGPDGADQRVEIVEGNAVVQATYTIRLRMDDGKRRVRFWLDHSRPHGIADAWGFFRVEPLASSADGSPRVLLTYGILVDLGPGLVRDFFESRIQAGLLAVPDRLRSYAVRRYRTESRG
jgi:hypothetical protein